MIAVRFELEGSAEASCFTMSAHGTNDWMCKRLALHDLGGPLVNIALALCWLAGSLMFVGVPAAQSKGTVGLS